MELKLVREIFTDNSTIGKLYNGDVFLCYTLEDMTREEGIKIPGRTSIPYGRYEIAITFSLTYNRKKPILLNVTMFEGIRKHSCIDDDYTEGCILVGLSKGKDMIWMVDWNEPYLKITPKIKAKLKQYYNEVIIKGKDCEELRFNLHREIVGYNIAIGVDALRYTTK